jgi:hypothetical protein
MLAQTVEDVWWHETTLLYVADADAGPVVAACLKADTVPALALAFDCAEEARELNWHLRELLDKLRSEAAIPGVAPERRRLMIGVTLTRQLRWTVRVADGTRLCTSPITWGIYRNFLEDMADRGEYRYPDCPPSTASDPEEMVTGVRGGDAVAFVRWVNEQIGGEPDYRLPTRDEIKEFAAKRAPGGPVAAPRGAWTTSDGGDADALAELWSLNDSCTIDAEIVRRHLESDFRESRVVLHLLLIRAKLVTAAIVRDLDRDLAGALVDHLMLTLSRARELADDLAHELVRPLDRAVDLASKLALAFGRALEVVWVRDLELATAFGHARDLDNALDAARVHARDPNIDRALDLDRSLDRDLAGSRALNRAHALDLVFGTEGLVGAALSQSIDHVLNRSEVSSTSLMAQSFADVVLVPDKDYGVSPDAIVSMVRAVTARLLDEEGCGSFCRSG